MLVFRKGVWKTVDVPHDPMLSYAHRQRLAAAMASGNPAQRELEFYKELFPGLGYHESLGKSIAAHKTVKKSAV